jgi:hypothetical protein
MIKLQTRYGSKAKLQPFTKRAVVKFSLKSRLQDQSVLPGPMGLRELARHELLPNPLTAEKDADGKKVSEMEEEEEQDKEDNEEDADWVYAWKRFCKVKAIFDAFVIWQSKKGKRSDG